jgi:hypothetical protein
MNEKYALYIIRYAIETYLLWKPEEIVLYLNQDIISKLKLTRFLGKVITPGYVDLKEDADLYYLAAKIYPDEIHFSEKDMILRVYKEVSSGIRPRFPKKYLSGYEGYKRVELCFRYMVTQKCSFSSIEEAYDFFATREGSKMLSENHLKQVCSSMYDSPVELLHKALLKKDRDELLYAYHELIG